MSDLQYTQDDSGAQGENQDLVQERDAKAEVLAQAVEDREDKELTTVKILLAACVFFVVASFSALAYGLHKVNVVADANTRVVCNLRTGYEEDLAGTIKFRKANPNGGVIANVHFTRADLDKKVLGLQARLDSTKGARC